MAKFLQLIGGKLKETSGTAASTGAPDAGKIVQLDGAGKLDVTTLPSGVGPAVALLPAFEALSAGDNVNVFLDAGVAKVRKADASAASLAKVAHGYVSAAVSAAAQATVNYGDINSGASGLTVGADVFLGVAGAATSTAPTTAGHASQLIGRAISATSFVFESQQAIELA